MGSFLDSRRFRKEIAMDLGVRRRNVHGFTAGEHGFQAVPPWSAMHVYGCKEDRLNQAAARMRKGHTLSAFHSDVHEGGVRLRAELKEGRFREAFSVMQEYLPDIRAILKPFVIRQSGAKTVMGTARATSKMLRAVTLGADALVSGQIALVGEWTASAAPSECHS